MKENAFGAGKQIAMAVLAVGLWMVVVWVSVFMTSAQGDIIVKYRVDKIFHFAGGLFLALAIEWRLGRVSLKKLLFLVFAIAVSWEIYEYAFDRGTKARIARDFLGWQADSAADIITALAAAALYRFLSAGQVRLYFRSTRSATAPISVSAASQRRDGKRDETVISSETE